MKERYESSVPLMLDDTILFLSIVLSLYGSYATRGLFWFPFLGLFLPWILSIIPSKFECDEKNLVMYDVIRGKKVIPLSRIQDMQISVSSLNIKQVGSKYSGYVHHYEFELKIMTEKKKYKFRMNAKRNIVEYPGQILNSDYYCDKVAFFRLKKYIEKQLSFRM
ncbi:MAG: hypothetical protein K2H29_02440 [Oscillospiraceae bacterium]|nr:hypothetical protein [Oscillospiraceae bacterium]